MQAKQWQGCAFSENLQGFLKKSSALFATDAYAAMKNVARSEVTYGKVDFCCCLTVSHATLLSGLKVFVC